MISAETEEHARLDHCRTRLQEALRRIEARPDEYAHDVDAQRDSMWEARRDMDHIERISARQSMDSYSAWSTALASSPTLDIVDSLCEDREFDPPPGLVRSAPGLPTLRSAVVHVGLDCA